MILPTLLFIYGKGVADRDNVIIFIVVGKILADGKVTILKPFLGEVPTVIIFSIASNSGQVAMVRLNHKHENGNYNKKESEE